MIFNMVRRVLRSGIRMPGDPAMILCGGRASVFQAINGKTPVEEGVSSEACP